MAIVDEIVQLFKAKGSDAYFGENVSQLEHALQAAHFAEAENAPSSLIVAALLHDVGHLLHDLPENIADKGIDTKHEELGEAWLAKYFAAEVYQPVRLHVAAKRYLCATDKSYLDTLSPASVQSLHLQGGPMTEAELDDFEDNSYYNDAFEA